jgi:hypothetical protein
MIYALTAQSRRIIWQDHLTVDTLLTYVICKKGANEGGVGREQVMCFLAPVFLCFFNAPTANFTFAHPFGHKALRPGVKWWVKFAVGVNKKERRVEVE